MNQHQDIQIAPALPNKYALSYEKFPGFKETLARIRDNEPNSFKVEFPENFDMTGEYVINYPNGSQTRHSMTFAISYGHNALVCYHPYQVLEVVAVKQEDFQRKEQMRKVQESQEEAESKKNIEDIKAKLAALDLEDDED